MTFSCSRIDHTIRIDTTGDVYFCCAMRGQPMFASYQELRSSEWYKQIKDLAAQGIWPTECQQCKDQEDHGQPSFRTSSNRKHAIFRHINPDYRILDVSTDNVCNAACQTCNAGSSTFYAKTFGKKKLLVNKGESLIAQYLSDNVVQIDLSGGEPLYSRSYKNIIDNLPNSVRWLRINTNGSIYYDFASILDRNIILELTVSFDATGRAFEYIRWPLKWDQADENFNRWVELKNRYASRMKLSINFTVSALNIALIDDMRQYAKIHGVGLSYNYLNRMDVLDIRYRNHLTERAINVQYDFPIACDRNNDDELTEWLERNDQARKINYRDYLGENNGKTF
jgi:hypothetical protein